MNALGGPGVGWLWVIAIGVLGLSCFGIFAACSEKDLALKIVRTRVLVIREKELKGKMN